MGVKEFLLEILYPARCPLCEEILPGRCGKRTQFACKACVERIPYIHSPRCMKCGKQLEGVAQEYCQDCEKREHIFERGIGVSSYSDEMRQSLHRYKYKARREYTEFYGRLMDQQCRGFVRQWGIDVLVPVPMYAHKKKVRGYNQAELLAKRLGEIWNLPVEADMLVRCRNTRPMKELDDRERRKNLQNAFKVRKSVVKYKKVLLIDDIYTTGSTMDACATVLKMAGVEQVYCACLCIGNGF